MALKIFTAALWATWLLWLQVVQGHVIDHQSNIADIYGGDPCTQKMELEGTLTTSTSQSMPAPPTDGRIRQIRLKYEPLFERQPNYSGLGEGSFKDADGDWTDTWGIVVYVTKKVKQSTLPTADRIPACLEGVPVQIQVAEPATHYGKNDD